MTTTTTTAAPGTSVLEMWHYEEATSTWTELDIVAQRLVNLKLQISYAHAHMLSFTLLQPQHTVPIVWGDWIYLYDAAFAETSPGVPDTTQAIFEGHVHEITPRESNAIDYVCYDPTRRAGYEIGIMSGPNTWSNQIPRLVFNPKIETDDDNAYGRRSDATVGEIIEDILSDPWAFLYGMGAAQQYAPAYVQADLDLLTEKPQEKIVFESENLRSGLDRMMSRYPQFRMIFEPGDAKRQWRFRDVKAAPQITLTLNSITASKKVLSMGLQRSLENRYTAIKIYGPQKMIQDTVYESTGGLTEVWTPTEESNFLLNGPGYPGTEDVSRKWQVTDNDKKMLSRILVNEVLVPLFTAGTVGAGLAFARVKTPILLATWDSGSTWEPINGLIFVDTSQGIIAAPHSVYKTTNDGTTTTGGPTVYNLPDDVKFIFAYFGDPITARYPTTGYSGTAYDVFGMEVEMKRYDESLAIGYERGIPYTSAERTAQFVKLAENIHSVHKDVIYSGGCTIADIQYDFLFLNKRVNFAAVDEDGNSLTTGWEAINAILTDVEYDYSERLTTLQFSSDHSEYTQTDPDALKRALKIAATSPQMRTGTAILRIAGRAGFMATTPLG